MAKVGILNIGDELLIGQVINTNAADMAKILNNNGFDVYKSIVCSDNAESIRTNLRNLICETDIVLITGGLGPTKDDITKKILAEEFDSVLITDSQVLEHVEQYFTKRGLPFTETNREQALVPDKCQVIFNNVGTAPGMCFNKDGKIIISMPGVPFEMRFMMNKVIEIIKKHFDSETIEHRTLLLSGIGESFLSDMLEDFEANLPSNISLAYLPKGGTLRLRLTVKGKDKQAVIDSADSYCADLRKRVDEYFMGFDSDNIAQTLGKRLIERKETITTAESCTGGNIAHLITLVAGSSRYYKGSVVSYANEVKENLTLDEIAKRNHISVSYMKYLFNMYAGIGPKHFFNMLIKSKIPKNCLFFRKETLILPAKGVKILLRKEKSISQRKAAFAFLKSTKGENHYEEQQSDQCSPG